MTTVRTVATAAEATQASGRVLGGGTLLMREVNYRPETVPEILHVTDPALREIRVESTRVTLGAGVTMAAVIARPDLQWLAPVARAVGGPAVRNMATVGGNLFAPHPYGDFATALLALDAQVALGRRTRGGNRELPGQPGQCARPCHIGLLRSAPCWRDPVPQGLADEAEGRLADVHRGEADAFGQPGRGCAHRLRSHGSDAPAGQGGRSGASGSVARPLRHRSGACRGGGWPCTAGRCARLGLVPRPRRPPFTSPRLLLERS